MSVVTRHGPPPRQSTAAASSPGPRITRSVAGVRPRSQAMKAFLLIGPVPPGMRGDYVVQFTTPGPSVRRTYREIPMTTAASPPLSPSTPPRTFGAPTLHTESELLALAMNVDGTLWS